jgi:hypothetical protein
VTSQDVTGEDWGPTVDAFTAQYRAVVATAQLAAALPDVAFTTRVLTEHVDGARQWMVTIRWVDGPDPATVRWVLDGPPPGVHLLRHVSVPEYESDPRDRS